MATSLDEALGREAALIAERDGLVTALRNYLDEYDNPVPDYTLRRQYRRALRTILSKYPTEG